MFKLEDQNNKYYQYAVKKEISLGEKGNTAPQKYPPHIDLHPLINQYRNCTFFDVNNNKEDGWYEFIKSKVGKQKKGLTLGSGAGRHELNLSAIKVVEEWTSIDLVENPLDESSKAETNTFLTGDLNFMELPYEEFDLVYCRGILHHIVNLENLVSQIYKSLKPNGYLIVYEYVGVEKWQWSRRHLRLLKKEAKAILQEKGHKLSFRSKTIGQMNNRPLESIRSSEIPSIINNYFEPLFEVIWNKILYSFTNSRVKQNANEDPNYINEIISFAISLEKKYKDDNSLQPTELIGVYNKKSTVKLKNVVPWTDREIRYRLGSHKLNYLLTKIRYKINSNFIRIERFILESLNSFQ
jgi:SAM-dependent methyltransferase